MKSVKQSEFVVAKIDGGIGKIIQSTVPIRCYNKKYPDKKIVVVSGCPEVFFANPNVYHAYRFGDTPNFYDNYTSENFGLLASDPYYNPDVIRGKRYLTEVWCEMWGVPFDNPIPDIFVTDIEKEKAQTFVDSKEEPVLMLQISGGGLPPQGHPLPKMYKRNLPLKVGKALFEKLYKDYHIMLVRDLRQPNIKGTETINFPIRDIFALASVCDSFILIDSFLQHVCAALKKKAVVCWGGTPPASLGYDTNINLTKKVCPTPFCYRPYSFLFDMTATGAWDCPHGEACMAYKSQEIIDALPKEYVVKKSEVTSPQNVLDILKKKKSMVNNEPKGSIDEALEK
jgi:hypothetical protein